MKKIFFITLSICMSFMLSAQDEFDALRLNSYDIAGTARYTSMGGAFVALGADVSAIKDNPAGLGVFRASETSLTLNLNTNITTATWNTQKMSESSFKMPITQASYIMNFNHVNKTKGLVSSNFAFQYNRLKTYNRRLSLKSDPVNASLTDFMAAFSSGLTVTDFGEHDMFDSQKLAWLSELGYQGYLINANNDADNTWSSILGTDEKVTPSYSMYESGYLDEYAFSWGGNIGNMVYVGASLNLRALSYSLVSTYDESFGNGGGFSLENTMKTSGVGVNMGFGVIVRPINFLRLGLSVQIPTLYSLSDNHYADMSYSSFDSDANKDVSGSLSTPSGNSQYRISSPFKLNGGVALVMGKKGLVSLEYGYDNYRGMQLRNSENKTTPYDIENQSIKTTLNDMHTLKLGAELKLTNYWAVRAGGAYQTASAKSTANKYMSNMLSNSMRTDMEYFRHNGTAYASAGIGYRDVSWYFDLAYQYRLRTEQFYAFDSRNLSLQTEPAHIASTNHNVILTLGFKF